MFEKESSTLEKDKEDRSKYFLSHPKPSVLNTKWENRDFDVEERENIPKLSKLDDIAIPRRLFKL